MATPAGDWSGARSILKKWNRKITRLDRMAMVDCTPNAFAVVLGVAVAAFHVVWVVGGPECIDAAYDRMKKGAKPHRKFKARGEPILPAIKPPSGEFGNTMVKLGDMAQRVGLFFGLVDGALDGIYYGSSMIRRYSGCTNVTAPYCELSLAGSVPALIPAADFIMNIWKEDHSQEYVGGPLGVNIIPDPLGQITVTCALQQSFNQFPPLQDCSFSYRVLWMPSGDTAEVHWGGLGKTLNGSGVLYGQDIIRHPTDTLLVCAINKTEGVLTLSDGRFVVVGGRIGGNLSPYSCKAETGVFG